MLTRWNDPFRDLQSFQSQMNRLFNETFGSFGRGSGEEGMAAAWAPPVDVSETPDHLTFSVEVPGFKQDDLNIRLENGVLTIEGERKFEEQKKDKEYHRVERSYGRFYRSFALPVNVDAERVSANLQDGVLHIELPKKEESKPKSIPIGSGSEAKQIPASSGGRKVA